jgi:hypothetical protein
MRTRTVAAVLLAIAGFALACGDAATDGDPRIDALFGEVPYGTLNRAQAARLLDVAPADDRPFHLVQLIRHRARAAYADGRPRDLKGVQADAIYEDLLRPLLDAVGAQSIYVADVEQNLIDRDGAGWDRIEVVRYPGRAQLVALLERPDVRAATVHRVAGVERAIALVTEKLPDPIPEALRRVDLASLPFPPSPGDPPVTVVHLLDFRDRAEYPDGRPTDLTGREAFTLYEQARAPQALPLGVRPGMQLAVEGELIGDGRAWEEVRINNFPSRAAFAQLVSRESLDQAGYQNREAGIADTYGLLGAPRVNLIGYLEPEGASRAFSARR